MLHEHFKEFISTTMLFIINFLSNDHLYGETRNQVSLPVCTGTNVLCNMAAAFPIFFKQNVPRVYWLSYKLNIEWNSPCTYAV